jgi:hypothetical protein
MRTLKRSLRATKSINTRRGKYLSLTELKPIMFSSDKCQLFPHIRQVLLMYILSNKILAVFPLKNPHE